MRLKWEWFVGGRGMFWLSIIVFVIFLFGFTVTYIIDPITLFHINKLNNMDATKIREISEKYVADFGIKVNRSIEYRFVRYKHDKGLKADPDEEILLGTFHEWNNTYYINISVDLYNMTLLERVVIHETRHMLVEYMKDEGVIDLTDYTEEIASNEQPSYDSIFRSGIYLLKYFQEEE